MSDRIKKDAKIKLPAKKEQELRQAIDLWAQETPYHDHRNLGSEMKILDVQETSFYIMRLWSQTDHRYVSKAYIPYTGQRILERKYFSESAVDVWAFDYKDPDAFLESSEVDTIDQSQHKEDCFKCRASGKIQCPRCTNGRVNCPNCSGSGTISQEKKVPCSACGGKGYHTRYKTVREPWGNGYHDVRKPYEERCKSCIGEGRVKSYYYETCSRCHGSGKITCSLCSGTAKITCDVCKGKKELLHYYNLNRQLKDNYYSDVYNGLMTSEESDFFLKSLKDADQNLIFEDYDNEGIIKNPELAKIPILGSSIDALLTEAHAQQNAATHILFEKVHIHECPLLFISYSYKEAEYRMFIKQTDGIEIVALDSPIAETLEKLRNEAIAATKMRRFSAAYTKLNKAMHFPQAEQRDKRLFNAVKRRMKNAVEFGIQMSAYVATIFMLILGTYYYREINYVLPWADFANKTSGFWENASWANVLITIALFFLFSIRLRASIPQKFCLLPSLPVRISLGFVIGAVTMTAIALLWAIINFTGIGALLSAAVWGVIYVVIVIIAFIYMILYALISWIIGLF